MTMNTTDKTDRSETQSILITDSGLGGLSVFNDIANQLEHKSPWQSVRLVYFNAWPAPHRGYNHFDTLQKRAQIFNNALYSMLEFNPDQILIACNTLSVIYPHTEFCAASAARVEGIVDHGVKMINEKLAADPDSVAVILGTPTTIQAQSHKKELVRLGIGPDRIINTGCTNLAGWIERKPFSREVARMITRFVKETGQKLSGFTGHIYAGLCCTHFGYKEALFKEAFADYVSGKVTLLNPNVRMAQTVLESDGQNRYSRARIDMQIVSKAVWEPKQIDAYLKLMPDMSKTAQTALKNYSLNTQLFSVD